MRIIVGISGASGVIMGYYLLKELRTKDFEIHLIITESARLTWSLETDLPISALEELADVCHKNENIAASVASGSFETSGMIIVPCSMKTLAGIASGYASNLLLRAADVCLKEGRKVILVPREMPLGKVHIRNLKEASDLGCVLVPPMLTFYNAPQSLDDQINHIVGKLMMQIGCRSDGFQPWKGVPG